jgi:hypothetical protein
MASRSAATRVVVRHRHPAANASLTQQWCQGSAGRDRPETRPEPHTARETRRSVGATWIPDSRRGAARNRGRGPGPGAGVLAEYRLHAEPIRCGSLERGNAAKAVVGRVSERGPGDSDRLSRFLPPAGSRPRSPADPAFAAGCLVGRGGGNETPAPGVGGRFDGTGGRLGRRCSTMCSDQAVFLRLASVCRLETAASLPFVMWLASGQSPRGSRGFCIRAS